MFSFVLNDPKTAIFKQFVNNGKFIEARALLEEKVPPSKKSPIEVRELSFEERIKEFNRIFSNGLNIEWDKEKWAGFLKFLLETTKFKALAFDLLITNMKPALKIQIKKDLIEFVLIKQKDTNHQKKLLDKLLTIPVGYLLPLITNEDLLDIVKKNPALFAMVIETAIKKFKLDLLYRIKEKFPDELDAFLKASHNERKDKESLEENKARLRYFLSLNKHQAENLQERMKEFTNGFGHTEYTGGLLTCAQIRARKKDYDFNPTLLGDKIEEFKAYLEILKTSPGPHRERFVITGTHWISGDIKIDEKGHVSVLFIDSGGYDTSYPLARTEAIRVFAKVFEPEKSTIYLSSEKRQHGLSGCSIFSLDDVRHLYTAERYLPQQYQDKGLFGYLEHKTQNYSGVQDATGKTIPVLLHHLPLSLVRTMQSRDVDKVIADRLEEKDLPVKKGKGGKLGITAQESVDEHYTEVPIFSENLEEKTKKQNIRLDYTINKFAEGAYKFLRENDEKAIQEKTKHFTLAGFKERMEKKVLASKVVPDTTKSTNSSLKIQTEAKAPILQEPNLSKENSTGKDAQVEAGNQALEAEYPKTQRKP